MADLFFDDEFRRLIPPLTPEELSGLEQSLVAEGNRDPVVIWKEKQLLLDGHNRYDLCHKNNIKLLPPLALSFPDREAAMIWIIDNQLSRRNLPVPIRIELNILKYDLHEKRKAKEKHEATYPKVGQRGFQPVNDTQISEQHTEPKSPRQKKKEANERTVDAVIGKRGGQRSRNVRRPWFHGCNAQSQRP